MPVSATASSTQSRPSATLRTRSATSPCFVNLQALLKRLSRICLSRMGSAVSACTLSRVSTTRRLLFLSASCTCSASSTKFWTFRRSKPASLLVTERLEFQSVDGDGSNEVVPFQHRDGERRPDWPLVSHSIGILGIALDIRDVYRSPLEGSTRRDAVASRSDRILIYELRSEEH